MKRFTGISMSSKRKQRAAISIDDIPLNRIAVTDSLRRLNTSVNQCRREPTFENAANLCNGCRAAFADYILQWGLDRSACNQQLLESSFNACLKAVQAVAAGSKSSKDAEKLHRYAKNIQSRLSLGQLLHSP